MSRVCRSVNFVLLVWTGRPSALPPVPIAPNIQMAFKPFTNRNRKMWRCCVLHEVQFSFVGGLSNGGQQTFGERVEVAHAFLCVLITLKYQYNRTSKMHYLLSVYYD
jgi:hypothetical protein